MLRAAVTCVTTFMYIIHIVTTSCCNISLRFHLQDDGILRNSSIRGPYWPSGSSGIMNMSSTSEYGSNLNATAEHHKRHRQTIPSQLLKVQTVHTTCFNELFVGIFCRFNFCFVNIWFKLINFYASAANYAQQRLLCFHTVYATVPLHGPMSRANGRLINWPSVVYTKTLYSLIFN